jgi:signal transduction histidine kinase
VGQFEVSRSLSDVLSNLTGIAIISAWFGAWAFLILRTLPARALQNAIDELGEAKESAFQALRERDKAEEAARTRSLFLSNISHELRTPRRPPKILQ